MAFFASKMTANETFFPHATFSARIILYVLSERSKGKFIQPTWATPDEMKSDLKKVRDCVE